MSVLNSWRNEEEGNVNTLDIGNLSLGGESTRSPPFISLSNRSSSISSLDGFLCSSQSEKIEEKTSKSWDNSFSSPLDNLENDDDPNNMKSKIEFDVADVECMLCFRLLYQPVTIICGHTYCKNCILASVKRSTECPLCSKKLCNKKSEFEYSISYILSGLIEKHFKTEYKEREREEKDIIIDLKETNEITEPLNMRNVKKTQTRRRNSGWWKDDQSILLYPCDM